MNSVQLMILLQQIPEGIDWTVKGRRETLVSCSIPAEKITPNGWVKIGECVIQQLPGYKRVRKAGFA